MSLLTYKKFKIIISGDSPKENGLQYGDIVIRKYLENSTSYYSILYVTEVGTTPVTINGEAKTEKWFIGALLYGDEPATDQPLDFTRMTSLSNPDRMGAIYLTSVDTDAPYIDIIDRIGREGALNFPRYVGIYGQYDKFAYAYNTPEYFSGSYIDESSDKRRVFRLTKNSTAMPVGTSALIAMKTLNGSYADQKVVVSYKYRSSGNFSIPVSVSDSNGNYSLMSETISSTTTWKSALSLFSVSNIHTDSYFKFDISSVTTSEAYVEISDFTIIPLNSLVSWQNQTKSRIGKLSGVSDNVFGELKDYGAYLQRLYASKDVNISGTLTAGDKNGFGSTFYAGKIHKNVVLNSMNHDWGTGASVTTEQINPTGIGDVFLLSDMSSAGNNHRFTYNDQTWYQANIGKQYVFSAWFKSGSGEKTFTLDDNDSESKAYVVGENWTRVQYSFTVGSTISNNYCFIDISGADTNSNLYICGMQVEEGEYATAYQPTDGTLTPEDGAYGVWMSRGGIGGTIQNPLLRFNPDGSIRSRGDRFYITNDGNAYFEGNITASSGNIGGWVIAQESLYRGVEHNASGEFTGASGSITIGTKGIRGFKWRFEDDGSGALAGGKISFGNDGSALIASWNIDEDAIYTGIKKDTEGYSSSGITIHSSGAIRAMYARIESDGKLYASNADIAGKITASSGEIGAWKIDSNSFYSGTKADDNNSFSGSAGSVTLWSSGAISARYFRLGSDGKIYATGADIAGKISATEGAIGGWTIDGTSFYSGTKATNNASNTTSDGSITIWSSGAISARFFRVGTDGKLYASSVDIAGKITGTSGTIGGWTIDSNSIYLGTKVNTSGSYTAQGDMTIGSSGIRSFGWMLNADGSVTMSRGKAQFSESGHVLIGAGDQSIYYNAMTGRIEFGVEVSLNWTSLAMLTEASKMIYRDPAFTIDVNGMSPYGDNVTVTRVQNYLNPAGSNYAVRIRNTGASGPGIGGFYFGTPSYANAKFITKINAIIPVGRKINFTTNAYGTGGTYKWLTSQEGTGNWQDYIIEVTCGGSGTFSSTNYFFLDGYPGTVAAPVDWTVGYATVFNAGSPEKWTTTIDANGIYTGTLTAGQVNAINVSGQTLTFTKGTIGSWTFDSDSLFTGTKQSSSGYSTSGITIHSSGAIRAMYARIESDGKLYAKAGQIGIWNIDDNGIYNTAISGYGDFLQIRPSNIGSGTWYTGSYKPKGVSFVWHRDSNAGHLVFGQIAETPSTARSGFMGIQMMDHGGTEYFCLSASTTSSGSQSFYNKIAGWRFDGNSLYSGVKASNDTSYTTENNSITMWSSGAMSGKLWRIGPDGKFYATDGYFSGEIQSSSGKIGGFTIGANGIGSVGSSGVTRMYLSDNYVRVGSTENLFSGGQNTVPSGMAGFNAMANVFIRNISTTTGVDKAGVIVDLGNTVGARDYGFITNAASYGASFIGRRMHYAALNSSNSGGNSTEFWNTYSLAQRDFIMIYSYAEYTLYLPGLSYLQSLWPTGLVGAFCIRFTIHSRRDNAYNVIIGSQSGAEIYNQNGDVGSRTLGRGDTVDFVAIYTGSSFYYQVVGFTYGL